MTSVQRRFWLRRSFDPRLEVVDYCKVSGLSVEPGPEYREMITGNRTSGASRAQR